jgi:hypothetical protein
MDKVRYFSQEIGTGCNLAHEHSRCPQRDPSRYALVDTRRLMSDETILNNIKTMYSHGFRGYLGWHYYNEPLLYLERIERLHPEIKKINPNARLLAWTNGVLLKTINPSRMNIFDFVIITNHAHENWSWFRCLHRNARVTHGRLDRRMSPGPLNMNPCNRIKKEFVIDAYGNWRLCCADWRGTSVDMNVHTDGIERIIKAYKDMREVLSHDPIPESVPDICKNCIMR